MPKVIIVEKPTQETVLVYNQHLQCWGTKNHPKAENLSQSANTMLMAFYTTHQWTIPKIIKAWNEDIDLQSLYYIILYTMETKLPTLMSVHFMNVLPHSVIITVQ